MPSIRFGTFNLYQFAPPPMAWYRPESTYTDSEWSSKKAWIKNQLSRMNCDVVGFQEVFSAEALKELVAEAGYTHFATVDSPTGPEDDNVYRNPVVAIASRLPFDGDPSSVSIPGDVKGDLPLSPDTDFSRTPIRAKVLTEEFGVVTVFVAHLKSKRPMTNSPAFDEADGWDLKIRETMKAISRGHTSSLLQRGAEATALYHLAMDEIEEDSNRPVVVLGDLNDDNDSIPLEALTSRGRVMEVGKTKVSDLPGSAKKYFHDYRLYDAYTLRPNPSGEPRKPTHVYGKHGSVLDYALVSNAFNVENPRKVGVVTSHEVFDEHIYGDGDHMQSDHAQVAIEISKA